jgi:hypothetical protein
MRASSHIYFMKPIDIVVPYVNPWDPEWLKTTAKYGISVAYNRVRDLGTLRYFFRGVEKNMPWIHNVYLVLQSESQIPSWLNVNHPKLKIVYHRDFIPKKFLPTCNSSVIEMFFYKIKGLTKHFIIANDDMAAIRPLEPTDFFRDDKVVVGPVVRQEYWRPDTVGIFAKTLERCSELAGVFTHRHNRPFYRDYHLFYPHLKRIHKTCWARYKRELLKALSHSRVRKATNVCQTLFYFIYMELGLYECDHNYKRGFIRAEDGSNPEKMLEHLCDSQSKMCCMQDEFRLTNDVIAQQIVQAPLHHFLPEKSSFEL